MRTRWLLTLGCSFLFFALGCSTAEKNSPEAAQERIDSEYDYSNLIESHTKGDSLYDGFYNTFQYQATLLNTRMVEAQLRKKGALQLWDAERLEQERTKKYQEMAAKTEVFLSFFSPQKGATTLTDKKTVWRAYLDVDGRRYIGDIRKLILPMPDVVALYPFHNRWSTAYIVTFPVPTSSIEKHPAKFTLTGSVGTSSVQFSE